MSTSPCPRCGAVGRWTYFDRQARHCLECGTDFHLIAGRWEAQPSNAPEGPRSPDDVLDRVQTLHSELRELDEEYRRIVPGIKDDAVYKRTEAITERQREIWRELVALVGEVSSASPDEQRRRYDNRPIHGIVRGRAPCKRCGIRAWRWHRPEPPDGPAYLICIGCDHSLDGTHFPCRVLFRAPGADRDANPEGRLLQLIDEIERFAAQEKRIADEVLPWIDQCKDYLTRIQELETELEKARENNVVQIGNRLVCHRCEKPIASGQPYAQVRLPGGQTVPVHPACMEGPTG